MRDDDGTSDLVPPDVAAVQFPVINGTPFLGYLDGRVVKVTITDLTTYAHTCTGTLIRADIVLTAKHCLR
jgi:hypothetical protein